MATTSSEKGNSGDPAATAPIPMFEILTQYQPLRAEIEQAVRQVLDATEYIGGAALKRFEENLGRYTHAHAVAVSSGTDAILAALMALGIGRGDDVVTTPFTFFATAGCIARAGAKPVFVDIDPDTFLVNMAAVEAAIIPSTRGILPVHLFGQMCDMGRLMEIARPRGLAVIEDAAQSIGARDPAGRQGAEAGTAACLSFYPTKNLGAAGDAGAVLTRDAELAKRIAQTRQHGETTRYHHAFVGGNFRLDGIQCAVLDVKLKHVDKWNTRRRRIAEIYNLRFAGSDVRPPAVEPGAYHVYHQYVVRAPRRDALRDHLINRGIGCAVYYPLPLHLQECFSYLGYKQGQLPIAEQACREVLALPVFPELTDAQVNRVADGVLEFYRG